MNEKPSDIMFLLGQISADTASTKEMIEKQSKKIDALQSYQDKQKGQLTVVSIMWGTVSAAVVTVIAYFLKSFKGI